MPTLYTVGHSNRSSEELALLLAGAGVRCVADVRRFPSSRRNPHFNRKNLADDLEARGLRYVWLGEALGGRRESGPPRAESPNRAWQDDSFRLYADALYTLEFRAGWLELEGLVEQTRTAILCAERDWWHCHRQLLADLFVVEGGSVVHVVGQGRSEPHRLNGFARVEDGRLSYPALL